MVGSCGSSSWFCVSSCLCVLLVLELFHCALAEVKALPFSCVSMSVGDCMAVLEAETHTSSLVPSAFSGVRGRKRLQQINEIIIWRSTVLSCMGACVMQTNTRTYHRRPRWILVCYL